MTPLNYFYTPLLLLWFSGPGLIEMNLVLAGFPRRESSFLRLSSMLEQLLKEVRVVYLPLPIDVCREVVEVASRRKEYDPGGISNYIGASLERLWRPVLGKLAVILGSPGFHHTLLSCLYDEEFKRTLEDRGGRLAYLLFKANAYGKVSLDEWIDVFADREPSSHLEALRAVGGSRAVYLTDRYRDIVEAEQQLAGVKACFIEDFTPTPLEVVDIIVNVRRDLLPALREAVDWSIRYLNILVRSSSFDKAYEVVAGDSAYKSMLRKLGLKVFREPCTRMG